LDIEDKKERNKFICVKIILWKLKLLLKKDVCIANLSGEKVGYIFIAKKIQDTKLDKDNFVVKKSIFIYK